MEARALERYNAFRRKLMKTPGRALLGGQETPQAIQSMLLSLLVACGILFSGMFWTYHVGLQANILDHSLDHAQDAVAEMRATVQHQKEGKK
jgi:hypothetical protein